MQSFEEMMAEILEARSEPHRIFKKEKVKWDRDLTFYDYNRSKDQGWLGGRTHIWQSRSNSVPRSRSPEVAGVNIDNMPGYRRKYPYAWVTPDGRLTNDRSEAALDEKGRPVRNRNNTIATAADKRAHAARTGADREDPVFKDRVNAVHLRTMDHIRRLVEASEVINERIRQIREYNAANPDKPRKAPNLPTFTVSDSNSNSKVYQNLFDRYFREEFGIPPEEASYTVAPRDDLDDYLAGVKREWQYRHEAAEDRRRKNSEDWAKVQEWQKEQDRMDAMSRLGDFNTAYDAFMNPFSRDTDSSRSPIPLATNYMDHVNRLRAQLDSLHDDMTRSGELEGVPPEDVDAVVVNRMLQINPAFAYSWNRAGEMREALEEEYGIYTEQNGDIPEDTFRTLRDLQSMKDKKYSAMMDRDSVLNMIQEMRDGTRLALPHSARFWPEEYQEKAREALKTGEYVRNKTAREGYLHRRIQEYNATRNNDPSWSMLKPLFRDTGVPVFIRASALADYEIRHTRDALSAQGWVRLADLVDRLRREGTVSGAINLTSIIKEESKGLTGNAGKAVKDMLESVRNDLRAQAIHFHDSRSNTPETRFTFGRIATDPRYAQYVAKFRDYIQELNRSDAQFDARREREAEDDTIPENHKMREWERDNPLNEPGGTERMRFLNSVDHVEPGEGSWRQELTQDPSGGATPQKYRRMMRGIGNDRFLRDMSALARMPQSDDAERNTIKANALAFMNLLVSKGAIESIDNPVIPMVANRVKRLDGTYEDKGMTRDPKAVEARKNLIEAADGVVMRDLSTAREGQVEALDEAGLMWGKSTEPLVYATADAEASLWPSGDEGPVADWMRGQLDAFGDGPDTASQRDDLGTMYRENVQGGRVRRDRAGGYGDAYRTLTTALGTYHDPNADPSARARAERIASMLLSDPDFAGADVSQPMAGDRRAYVNDRVRIPDMETFRNPRTHEMYRAYSEEVKANPVNTTDPVTTAYEARQRKQERGAGRNIISNTMNRASKEREGEVGAHQKAREVVVDEAIDADVDAGTRVRDDIFRDEEAEDKNNLEIHQLPGVSIVSNDNSPETPPETKPEKTEYTPKSASGGLPMMSLRDMMIAVQKSDGKRGHPYGKPLDGNVFAYGASQASIGEGKDPVMPKTLPEAKGEVEGASKRKLDL